ncbi:MAG: glutamate formimidoyltransferase [Candidatus Cloacimonetes bacterium]|nr:glutamate formimidoyltransferase [Candidatus Cloacimonadota bacterium]MBL7086251.1 glutamate formimidoyltransferase [Candidatus Cloacimonadota bacterium]
MKLVECVPNFSEGRDRNIIKQITDAIEAVEDVSLLDVDPGQETNRTVVTFVGSPEAVAEAAFQAVKKAYEVIDMRNHTGAHPRMGATDVCPFVPVAEVSMEDCIEISKKVGKRVGEELQIPVYLYENSASSPERQNLAYVRKGEYEGLEEKLKDPEYKPDFGPTEFNAKAGALITGAREFLIAYNINLNTKDVKKAKDLALIIREKGRRKRDENYQPVCDKNGNIIQIPGLFTNVKGIGWYIPEYGQAQISINFTNYKISPPHIVFDKVRELALERGLVVTGSELVGLIPLEAMLMAGKYFLQNQGVSYAVSEKKLVHIATISLGLSDIVPFDPNEKIIEYRIAKKGLLVDKTISDFVDELASDSPAPGGGSVAALCGSLAAGLTSMVGNLTVGKRKFNTSEERIAYKENEKVMMEMAFKAQQLKKKLLNAIDEDTEAFNKYMSAMKLPKKTNEEKEIRKYAIQKAIINATKVPLETMKLCYEVIKLSQKAGEKGNPNAVSDAGVSAISALAGAKGAFLNVKINLPSIEDEQVKKEILFEAEEILKDSKILSEKVEKLVLEKMK